MNRQTRKLIAAVAILGIAAYPSIRVIDQMIVEAPFLTPLLIYPVTAVAIIYAIRLIIDSVKPGQNGL